MPAPLNITTVYERRRGCGFRMPGALYFRTDPEPQRECGALPIPCSVCPTCHAGIKQSRGWTWINLAELAAVRGCSRDGGCGTCPIADARIQKVGLLWIGERYYPTPEAFDAESQAMGLSRRISVIPREFKLGETWIALGHPKAIRGFTTTTNEMGMEEQTPTFTAGIFRVFKPARIEYVVQERDSQRKLRKLAAQGITLVRVAPIYDAHAESQNETQNTDEPTEQTGNEVNAQQ